MVHNSFGPPLQVRMPRDALLRRHGPICAFWSHAFLDDARYPQKLNILHFTFSFGRYYSDTSTFCKERIIKLSFFPTSHGGGAINEVRRPCEAMQAIQLISLSPLLLCTQKVGSKIILHISSNFYPVRQNSRWVIKIINVICSKRYSSSL